jgi:hypothetical protein
MTKISVLTGANSGWRWSLARTARTVYQITREGRLELVVQRDAALEVVFGSADPMSVVLLFAAGSDPAELSERLAARRRRIQGQLEAMVAERTRRTGQAVLSPLAVAAFRRGSCGSRRSCGGMTNSGTARGRGGPRGRHPGAGGGRLLQRRGIRAGLGDF